MLYHNILQQQFNKNTTRAEQCKIHRNTLARLSEKYLGNISIGNMVSLHACSVISVY